MTEKEIAIWELIDKMEQQLSQFQDKMDIRQIWKIFLDDIQNLISIEASALFLEDEGTHEFTLQEVSPEDKEDICRKEQELQIECGMFASIIKRRRPGLVPSLLYKGKKDMMLFILPFSTIKRTRGVAFLFSPIEERKSPFLSIYAVSIRGSSCDQCVIKNIFIKPNITAIFANQYWNIS